MRACLNLDKRLDGFGEGNFKALFKSIEADQIARGVLETS